MVEERMKDVSAQGKEKIDHVWMGERTKWDQKDEGVGKMQRDYVGKVKMEIWARDRGMRQESGGWIKGREVR